MITLPVMREVLGFVCLRVDCRSPTGILHTHDTPLITVSPICCVGVSVGRARMVITGSQEGRGVSPCIVLTDS